MNPNAKMRVRRTDGMLAVLRAAVAALATLHVVLARASLSDAGLLAPSGIAAAILVLTAIVGGATWRLVRGPRTGAWVAWGSVALDALALVAIARCSVEADPTASIVWAFVLWAPFAVAARHGARTAAGCSAILAVLVLASTQLALGNLDPLSAAWGAVGVPALLVLVAGLAVVAVTREQVQSGQQVRGELLDERDRAARLQEADDLKNTFLAAVSHELRTPLTSILGFSLTMLDRPEIDEAQRTRMLRMVVTEAEHLEDLLANLLDLERLTRGKTALVRTETDPQALVRGSVERAARRTERTVRLQLQPCPRVGLDAAKVERIVENLVGNALKYTPADAEVCVSLRPTADGVELQVDDAGPGIAPELRSTIFEPFRRGDAGGVAGTGIGLSLVDRFSRMHGGHAWVDERPGGGCRFQVQLPAPRAGEADPDQDGRGNGALPVSSGHVSAYAHR